MSRHCCLLLLIDNNGITENEIQQGCKMFDEDGKHEKILMADGKDYSFYDMKQALANRTAHQCLMSFHNAKRWGMPFKNSHTASYEVMYLFNTIENTINAIHNYELKKHSEKMKRKK